MKRESSIHNFLITAFAIGLVFQQAISAQAASGDLDTTFGVSGKITTQTGALDHLQAVALQTDGKIVVAGSHNVGMSQGLLARYNKDGSIDPTFGVGGFVIEAAHGGLETQTISVAIQSDGKIITAGYFFETTGCPGAHAWVVRYNADGSRDLTFGGGDGEIEFFIDCAFGSADTYLNGIAIQSNGKIIVSGCAKNGTSNYDFLAARLNTDGSLDTSFSFDGLATFAIGNSDDLAFSVAITPVSGTIVLAGYSYQSATSNDFALIRLNPSGGLDLTFGSSGKVTTDTGWDDRAYTVVLQPNGKIVAAGRQSNASTGVDFSLARYNSNGTLDTTFGTGGKVKTAFDADYDIVYGLGLQTDGKIVAAGRGRAWGASTNDFALARYNTNGSLDTLFSGDGKQTTDFVSGQDYARGVAIQTDGKVVVAGFAWIGSDTDIALTRYLP